MDVSTYPCLQFNVDVIYVSYQDLYSLLVIKRIIVRKKIAAHYDVTVMACLLPVLSLHPDYKNFQVDVDQTFRVGSMSIRGRSEDFVIWVIVWISIVEEALMVPVS